MSKPAVKALVFWFAAICIGVALLLAQLGAPGGAEAAGESVGRLLAHTGLAALATWRLARRKTPQWSWLKSALVYVAAMVMIAVIVNFRGVKAAETHASKCVNVNGQLSNHIVDRQTYDDIETLRSILIRAQTAEDARSMIASAITSGRVAIEPASDDMGSLKLSFSNPVSAREFCRIMRWKRPYAISPDVHQNGWIIVTWHEDVPDSFGPRIGTRTPLVGNWAVDAYLTSRPTGIPEASSGASSAYDLTIHDTQVTGVDATLSLPH